MMDSYDYTKLAYEAIKSAIKYVEDINHRAAARHDNYGPFYMDDGLYEIMQKTDKLINKMKVFIEWFEGENGEPS